MENNISEFPARTSIQMTGRFSHCSPKKSFFCETRGFVYFFLPPFPQLHFLHIIITSCCLLSYFTETPAMISIIIRHARSQRRISGVVIVKMRLSQ